ncbi:PREDICTED: transcription initiation factor TFIID subunit 2-like [Amphimedon queenslandica]|uniref:Transcription initiation factor TFIID subunit 2 n=2 Tax=Amphimedon queenslandica TaxID=400682 RepID=A0AAN0JCJ1_AMPQE|nr:PREDICTED: transcription initiation factor TFIID subunit 2-like [Amphimedon queenslandica]|eukprot:XP_019854461.1 PREDICTED: transcription initiation factor TFIID subunit 2-like [Amphimedon queenslandica]
MSVKLKRQSSSAISSSPDGRPFKLLHQVLNLSEFNFKKQVIRGSTELTVLPTTATNKLYKLPLNCKQCRILKVTINESRKGNFTYVDPTLSICPPDTKKRNLEYYSTCLTDAIKSCDYREGNGELVIKIPRDVYSIESIFEPTPIKVMIDFMLEQPVSGVYFASTDHPAYTHVYSYGWLNSSRLWFPCIDSYAELCHWDIHLTVPSSMIAVSCGELTDQVLSADGRKKSFHYSLSFPTSASCIGFAVGMFEAYPDSVLPDVTHYAPTQTLPLLKNTVSFAHEVFGFYEELLSTRFPHNQYRLVFVDGIYQDITSYAGLTLCSVNLLHPDTIIDQVMTSRRAIALAIAEQYFECYLLPQSWNDWWLPVSISQFITGLFCRKMFGGTDYQYWINSEHQRVCEYEQTNYLPPLCEALTKGEVTPTSFHSHSEMELSILRSKGHLILRMLQQKIGHDLLVQVFNKILTLASSGGSASTDYSQWQSVYLSTAGFLKLVLTVSGKDLSHFMSQWVGHSGAPLFHVSFNYIRKKNLVELHMTQDTPRGGGSGGGKKFVGPMTVSVQEYDGYFTHTIQVEESVSVYELPCHSKIRKAKKRKMPLCHGEEIEIEVSSLDAEVPVLWVRVDPEMQWIRYLKPSLPDTVWINVLQYERDVVAQVEAIDALKEYPSQSAVSALSEAITNSSFYYHVRIKAIEALAHVVSDLISSGEGVGPDLLVRLYRQLFCVSQYSNTTLVRSHDFTNIAHYFIHKAMPGLIASVRNSHGHCPPEVLTLLQDIIKYSDNSSNKYCDGYFRASLVDALSQYVTPPLAVLQSMQSDNPLESLQADMKIVLQEIVQFLNIDTILPTYKKPITVSCLKAIRVLQRMGRLPSSSTIFKQYNQPNQFIDICVTVFQMIADIIQGVFEEDLNYLLNIIDDPSQLPIIK